MHKGEIIYIDSFVLDSPLLFFMAPSLYWRAILFLPCLFVGLLVCWFVGLLVCWFVGLFENNFNKNHLKSVIADSNLILGIHMCHIKPHILMCEMSRSRSSFKVKGQIEGKKMQL